MTKAGGIHERLQALADDDEGARIEKRMPADQVIGLRMKSLFDLPKEPLDEVEALRESHFYEGQDRRRQHLRSPRTSGKPSSTCTCGATTASTPGTSSSERRPGSSAGTGSTSRAMCCTGSPCRRTSGSARTAITAAFWLILAGQVDDALKLATMLLDDEPLIQTSVCTALREIGHVDAARLDAFLAGHRLRISVTTRRMARVDRRDGSPSRA